MRVKINTKRIYLKISNLFYYYSISFVIILRSTQAARDALIFFFINDVYLYLLCTESSGKNCFIDDLKEEDIIWTSESVFSKKPLQCLCISFFFFRLLNNKVMVMETPSPQCVGREFVRQYYTLLNEVPLHLHR